MILEVIKKTPLYRLLAIIKDYILILIYFKGSKFELSEHKYKLINLDNYNNCFFGYYDYSPFNPCDNSLIAFHENNIPIYNNPDGSPIDIILYNTNNNSYEVIDSTTAWNWQQGSRLTWFDHNTLIYNIYDIKDNIYRSKIYNIISKQSQVFP